MNSHSDDTNPLKDFFEFHGAQLVAGRITPDEVVSDFERNFVWEDELVLTAKLRTYFADFLFRQNYQDQSVQQLEIAEKVLRSNIDEWECKEVLSYNLAIAADYYKVDNPDRALVLLDEALKYAIGQYVSDQSALQRPPFTIRYKDILENDFSLYLFGYIAITYARTFVILKNHMASELKEAMMWYDMACGFTARLLRTGDAENLKMVLTSACHEMLGLFMGAGENSGFELDLEDDEYADTMTGFDSLFGDDGVDFDKLDSFKILQSVSPISIITPIIFKNEFAEEEEEAISRLLPTLNAEKHQLEIACCKYLTEKIKYTNGADDVEIDQLIEYLDVFMEHLQRGHPWIVNFELFIAKVICRKEQLTQDALDWLSLSIAESTILIADGSFVNQLSIVGHLELLAEVCQDQFTNAFIFFRKLAFSYQITYFHEIFDGGTSLRDTFSLLDVSPEDLIKALMAEGRIGEAFEVQLGLGKLLERHYGETEAKKRTLSFTPLEEQLLLVLETLISRSPDSLETKVNQVRVTLKHIIETLVEEADKLQKQTQQLSTDLINKDRGELLDSDVAVLHYLSLENQISIVIVTKAREQAFYTEISRELLAENIRTFLELLKATGEDNWAWSYKEQGQKLYDNLIGDAVRQFLVANGIKRLLLAPHGVLRFVPFHALFDGEKYLIEDFAISLLADHTVGELKENDNRLNEIFLLGATFADQKKVVSLPNVNQELDSIRDIVEQSSSKRNVLYECREEQFNASTLTGIFAAPFGILHIASHFVANPANVGESEFQLGDGSKMQLKQLVRAADQGYASRLLVLSACETGYPSVSTMDNNTPAMLFHQCGVRSVVSSLWRIADESTSLLMKEFYAHLLNGNDANADFALRHAQLQMLGGKYGDEYRHPFYWAAFMLSGDWKFSIHIK